MPINYPDFLNAPNTTGWADVFKNALQSYGGLQQAQAQARENQLAAQYAEPMAQAELTQKMAQARVAGVPENFRELLIAYGGDWNAAQQALAEGRGVFKDESGQVIKAPPGAFPIAGMGVNEQGRVRDLQKKQLATIDTMKVAKHEIDQARKIIDRYPNLAGSFTNLIVNPKDDTAWGKLIKNVTNKEELAAIESLRKVLSGLTTRLGNTAGGEMTDARQRILETANANPSNRDAANRFALDELESIIDPYLAFEPDLRAGYGKWETLFDRERYTRPREQSEVLGGEMPGSANDPLGIL